MASIPALWFSVTSDYENFEEGVNDSDSFSISITSTNEFRWVEAVDFILVGTSGEEWRVFSPKTDSAITPTSFKIIQQSGFGSNTVQPIVANAVVLFTDANGRRIHEMTWDDLKQKFTAPDLTVLAEHITATGITCMALQKYPDMILWCVLTDGSLISFTYDREQNILAWADHPMTGATVQSVCVTPNSTTGEDEVTLTVQRTINSATRYYIEKLNSRALPALIADCYYVDCGYTYSGAASNTITGLTHLIGQTVTVFGTGGTSGTGGTIYSGLVVNASGVATLPSSNTATKAHVGIPNTPEVEPMRLDISGNGTTYFGSIKKISEIMVSLLNSANVKYGDANATDNLYEIDLTTNELINKSSVTGLFSGDVPLHFDGGFSVDDKLVITSTDPLPLTVRCLIPKVDITGR